jgi:hypothetical protein
MRVLSSGVRCRSASTKGRLPGAKHVRSEQFAHVLASGVITMSTPRLACNRTEAWRHDKSPADWRGSHCAVRARGRMLRVVSAPSATPAPTIATTASGAGFRLDLLRDKGWGQRLKYCGHVGLLHSRESIGLSRLGLDPGAPRALRELCLTLEGGNEDAVRRP